MNQGFQQAMMANQGQGNGLLPAQRQRFLAHFQQAPPLHPWHSTLSPEERFGYMNEL
jgi:hypothetical protein